MCLLVSDIDIDIVYLSVYVILFYPNREIIVFKTRTSTHEHAEKNLIIHV